MKRTDNLYETLISDENLRTAIFEVNRTHRWYPRHKPNRVVQRVEADIDGHVKELRRLIEGGFVPSKCKVTRRWDKSAEKWRDISEPMLWPDQYIHHAIVQTLQPIMMRGMDTHCCGSIRGRGIHYGMKYIKKWMKEDVRGTKYCAELDIRHFYDSLTNDTVMKRIRQLIKDRRMLEVCEHLLHNGVPIGAYYSQWFANTVLQPMDRLIRSSGYATHYLRYMDNITLFGKNKKNLGKLRIVIEEWLNENELELKGNWQIYPTAKRDVTALGYRYGHGYTRLRKRNELKLKRQLSKYRRKLRWCSLHFACGLMSRLGQLKHCNSVQFHRFYVLKHTYKYLKLTISNLSRKRRELWTTFSETRALVKP